MSWISDNWEKMAKLSKIENKTEEQQQEFSDRICIQNNFANNNKKAKELYDVIEEYKVKKNGL